MKTYLVECYWAGVTEPAFADTVTRLRDAARDLAADGLAVDVLDSLLVPADEVAFYRLVGDRLADVEQVCARAGLSFDRIQEYVQPRAAGTDLSRAPDGEHPVPP